MALDDGCAVPLLGWLCYWILVVLVPSFKQSRRLVWFTLSASVFLMGIAMFVMGEAAAVVLMTSIPSMLGLVAGWTHVTNKRETDCEKNKDV